MAYQRERREQRELALERMRLLLEQATQLASSDVDAASRRVKLAWNISTRCNARIPPEMKTLFCRKCQTFFASGTCRRRLDSAAHRLELTCLVCGRKTFIPYRRD